MAQAWQEVNVDGRIGFKVPANLEFVRKLGSGAYGCVASFQDPTTNGKVAVKKIANAFDDLIDGKRILREVKLLQSFRHDNILSILDLYPPDSPEFEDVYIVTDFMESDLHRVIRSRQILTEEHHQYFTYQILRGLKYLHSANVVHRDLKPSNILVNRNCDVKICDFGLSRGFADDDDPMLSEYVVTRWYRAPEIVLCTSEYTKTIDVWSVGCILAELIGRRPIFTGKDSVDQVKKIIQVIGTPSESDLDWLPKKTAARTFIAKQPVAQKKEWSSLYPNASVNACDALEAMLTFHPARRPDVRQCLELEYFRDLHVPEDEPVAEAVVDWAFDRFTPTKRLLQNYIYAECAKFHPSIAERDANMIHEYRIAL